MGGCFNLLTDEHRGKEIIFNYSILLEGWNFAGSSDVQDLHTKEFFSVRCEFWPSYGNFSAKKIKQQRRLKLCHRSKKTVLKHWTKKISLLKLEFCIVMNRRTWQLYDQISPRGRFGVKEITSISYNTIMVQLLSVCILNTQPWLTKTRLVYCH